MGELLSRRRQLFAYPLCQFRMEDGTEEMIKAGDSYTIPPGHDAWVEGDETFVGIEVMSAEQYARPQS